LFPQHWEDHFSNRAKSPWLAIPGAGVAEPTMAPRVRWIVQKAEGATFLQADEANLPDE